MPLEQVIRPFETNNPFARSVVVVTAGAPSAAVIDVVYGNDGAEAQKLSGSSSASISFYCDQKRKIKPLTSNIRRVENEDDPSQYVDVEEFTNVDTKEGSGQDYHRSRDKIDTSGTRSSQAQIIDTRTYPGLNGS